MAPYQSKYIQFKRDFDKYIQQTGTDGIAWEHKFNSFFIEEEYYLDRDHQNDEYPIEDVYKKMMKISKKRYHSTANSILWSCFMHVFVLIILAVGTHMSRESPIHFIASLFATGIHVYIAINDLFVHSFFEYMSWKKIMLVLYQFKRDSKNK